MGLQKDDHSVLMLISDFLSIITITICFILKIPQIINLFKVKNAHGISMIGLLMELTSLTIMFSYNYRSGYALLSYMEYPIILVQEWILIACVLFYKRQLNLNAVVGCTIYFLMLGSFVLGIIPRELLTFLVPLCTPVGASSKVIQLLEILRFKNSESVSVLTWFISAFTNFTRVFTIFMDSADVSLLLNFIVNTCLSSSIMAAAYYYKPKKEKEA